MIQVLIFQSEITLETTSKLSRVCYYGELILADEQNSQSAAETDSLTECHNQNNQKWNWPKFNVSPFALKK